MKFFAPSITRDPSSANTLAEKRGFMWPVVVLLSLLGLSLTSGCSVLRTTRPSNVYVLPVEIGQFTAKASSSADESLPWSLRIHRPTANGHLSKRPIVVIPAGNQIQVYASSVWNNPPPILLRDRLQDAFRSNGQLSSLSTDEKILFADYEIDSDLRAFQSEYRNGNPVIVIVLDVRLIDVATRRILSEQLFAAEQVSSGTSVENVVTAFGRSADQVTQQIVEWVIPRLPSPTAN